MAVVKTTCVSYLDFFKTADLIGETDKSLEMRNRAELDYSACAVSVVLLNLIFSSNCFVRL